MKIHWSRSSHIGWESSGSQKVLIGLDFLKVFESKYIFQRKVDTSERYSWLKLSASEAEKFIKIFVCVGMVAY